MSGVLAGLALLFRIYTEIFVSTPRDVSAKASPVA
jgi:hypothetical protein